MPAAVVPEGLKPTPPDLAVRAFDALPEERRTIKEVNAKLFDMGFAPVSKSTLYRWRGEVAHGPKRIPATLPAVDREALKGIPDDLIEALGLRMMIVAKGEGLDRVEDAIVRVVNAISNKAEAIAEQILTGEDAANAAKSAVTALAECAEAMHRVTAARTLISVGYRNFAEGDRLAGESEKYRAEAETTRNAARADNAKVINPASVGGFDDTGADDEALEALRDVEGK